MHNVVCSSRLKVFNVAKFYAVPISLSTVCPLAILCVWYSAMLATLKPPADRPIRWDVRCRKCRFIVKGPDPGHCPHCKAPVPPMPYF